MLTTIFLAADFLIVITSRTPSCRLLGHTIYAANDYRLLPLSPLSTTSAILDHPVERELVSLVEQGLRGGKLWFSYGWDLTNSLQRQHESLVEGKWRTRNVFNEMSGSEALKTPMKDRTELYGDAAATGDRPMWKRADDRFFWNKYLIGRMIEQTERGGRDNDLSRFILPVMYGSVELRQARINSKDLLFCLIARRSRYRAGTRYFTRGIDQSGHTANFNETEQILLLDPTPSGAGVAGKERLSFVQTRGSVPVFWAEINNLRYKPDLQIMDIPETTAAMRYHLAEQIRIYDEVWLVNLVNQKGYEMPVKEAFESAIAHVAEPRAHYVYFDFHHECKGLRFDRIQLLVDSLADDLSKMGYFHINDGGAVASRQTGVIRSNCMDCLDRTNVAQAALAKDAMQRQLREVGILSHKESLEDHPEFMHTFRNVWADHADTISKAYSGTGALKTDFTRTGRRTKEGALQDGINSIMRYVRNNFSDGPRQDAFDLLTGSWVARRGAIPPLSDVRPLLIRAMPYVLACAVMMLLLGATLPQYSPLTSGFYTFLWLILAIGSFAFIWAHGTSYVAWPRLNPPIEILNYQGSGFRGTTRGRGISSLGALGGFRPSDLRKSVTNKTPRMDEYEMGKRKRNLID